MAVEYRKSAWAELAEELPELILRYQQLDKDRAFQRLILEDKQEHQKSMTANSQNFQSEVSMYRDAKAEESANAREYRNLESSYRETGGDLEALNELYKSSDAIKVLDDISTVAANDYKTRAEYYGNKAQNHLVKSEILKEALYGDIFRAKQIISGGRGPAGGHIPGLWDIGDINYPAYVEMYGPNPLVEKFYKNVPGGVEQSLASLQLAELNKKIKQGKLVSDIGQQSSAKEKTEGDEANLYLGTRIKDSAINTRLNDWYTYQGVLSKPSDYTEDTIENAEAASIKIENQIGKDLAFLIGTEYDPSLSIEDQTSGLFRMFQDAHKHAVGRAESHLGVLALPSFGHFESMIEDAYRNYQLKNQSERKEFNAVASRIFGFDPRLSFQQFVDNYEKYRDDALFQDLESPESDILDEKEIESNFWESLFDDDASGDDDISGTETSPTSRDDIVVPDYIREELRKQFPPR